MGPTDWDRIQLEYVLLLYCDIAEQYYPRSRKVKWIEIGMYSDYIVPYSKYTTTLLSQQANFPRSTQDMVLQAHRLAGLAPGGGGIRASDPVTPDSEDGWPVEPNKHLPSPQMAP